MNHENCADEESTDEEDVPPPKRITTPCPPNHEEHTRLLADLDTALAVARWSMARFRVDRFE